jgi:deoxyribodipyrimidine photo-lyase
VHSGNLGRMTAGIATVPVPADRVRVLNNRPPQPDRPLVLYWMTSARRTRANFALQHALDLAARHGRPLVVLEALSVDYPWASDRLHRFVLDGMLDQQRALEGTPVHYYPYVEGAPGAGRGLVRALAALAVAVVTDDYPAFFIPRMLAGVAPALPSRLEAVDGNGLLPIRAADRTFASAYQFRRSLQRALPAHLEAFPLPTPLDEAAALPRLDRALLAEIEGRWAPADLARVDLATLPIDHAVAPSPLRGGAEAAQDRLRAFLGGRIDGYGEGRNHPDEDASSGLSPYLHFGHIGAHEVVAAILEREGWSPERLGTDARGARTGWWGLSSGTEAGGAEAFLDQVVTWRELGFNACATDPEGYDRFESLPDWAQRTLLVHQADPREALYDLPALAAARTSDEVWNAAQRQLLLEGRIHNYLRMLWGKRILEWTPGPREALAAMVELNNRYALDGRDPNSYSGILWCLGKYDRPWGPERPVFGTVRYMSSANTRRKLRLRAYLERFGPAALSAQAHLDL